MAFWDFATFATGAGCLTGVVMVFLKWTLGTRANGKKHELQLALERSELQERRIAELTRQNEQLQQQIEWHGRLIDSYERALTQPQPRNADERALAGRSWERN